jgi:hypothetical protein
VSQRRFSPCGLFSRAEDKVKLSDDEIEEAFTSSATVVELYFTRCVVLWAFSRSNHRFQLEKRAELFIRLRNKTLSIAAMRVRNPDRLACTIQG